MSRFLQIGQKQRITLQTFKGKVIHENYLKGRNFGGFGGFVKNPPKSAKLTSRQN